jgi:hypothetical protein
VGGGVYCRVGKGKKVADGWVMNKSGQGLGI